jgi:hypothetical protein
VFVNKFGEVFRVAYKRWLERNHLLSAPATNRGAPVEEGGRQPKKKSNITLPPVQEFDV